MSFLDLFIYFSLFRNLVCVPLNLIGSGHNCRLLMHAGFDCKECLVGLLLLLSCAFFGGFLMSCLRVALKSLLIRCSCGRFTYLACDICNVLYDLTTLIWFSFLSDDALYLYCRVFLYDFLSLCYLSVLIVVTWSSPVC